MVAIKFLLTLSVFAAPVVAYEKYLALIPNGANIGKKLGHDGDKNTPFGLAFGAADATWSKICTQKWPGADVTVGVALGDCKCTWTSGDPQVTGLSAPDTTGEKCKALDTPATSAPTPAPAPAPTSGPAANPTPAPVPNDSNTPTMTPTPADSYTPAPADSYTPAPTDSYTPAPTDSYTPAPATPDSDNTHDLCE